MELPVTAKLQAEPDGVRVSRAIRVGLRAAEVSGFALGYAVTSLESSRETRRQTGRGTLAR